MSVPGFSNTILSSGPLIRDCQLYDLSSSRKMASLVVDFTQVPFSGPNDGTTPAAFSFPEWTFDPNSATVIGDPYLGFQVLEFDLASYADGIGLDEVRSVICYARPTWGDPNFPATQNNSDGAVDASTQPPPLLTHVKTLQSWPLGARASSQTLPNNATVPVESSIFPFFASGSSMPCRILKASISLVPFGKFQLNFCNWDVRPMDLEADIGSSN